MSAYLETINRLTEEYKANVLALEKMQGRIAEYEAAAERLRGVYKCNIVISVSCQQVSIWLQGDGVSVPGEQTRAAIGGCPIYEWEGFDVI